MYKLYSKIFAKFYDSFMTSFEAKIEGDKKNILDKLSGKGFVAIEESYVTLGMRVHNAEYTLNNK